MGRKLLIVDDDRDMLKLLGLAFHRKGFEVVAAENGEIALQKAREEMPDLVVLDIMLPDISGLEVCQRLHQRLETANLPVLLLSAKGQTADKVAGLQAGAEDYMTKPFEMPELVARIELILSRSTQKRAPSGRVITFVGAKGGLGTSTTAVNVASALVARGKSTIIADFHTDFGTVCLQLGLAPRRTLADLVTLPADRLNQRAVSLSLETHHTGLRVLASPSQPLAEEPAPKVLEELFDSLRSIAEFVIVDAPTYSSKLSEVALTRSDIVAVIVEPQSISMAAAAAALSYLGSLGVRGDWVGVVVVNRIRSPLNLSPGDVQAVLNAGILGVIPSAGEACLTAERQGSPLILVQPDHLTSAALYELADRLAASRVAAVQF